MGTRLDARRKIERALRVLLALLVLAELGFDDREAAQRMALRIEQTGSRGE